MHPDQTHAEEPAQDGATRPSPEFEAELATRPLWSLMISHFQRLTFFEKQWMVIQALAYLCSLITAVTSLAYYFVTPSPQNCDDKHPLLEAFSEPPMTECIFLWAAAGSIRRATRKLNDPISLPLDARRRRKSRIAKLLTFVGCGYFFAAFWNGIGASVASDPALGSTIVPALARIAVAMCILAGLYNLWLAFRIIRFPWPSTGLDESGERKQQQKSETAQVSIHQKSFLFDLPLQTLNQLPNFLWQWVVARGLTVIAIQSFQLTGTILWCLSTCDAADRNAFYGASHQAHAHQYIMATVIMLPTWKHEVSPDSTQSSEGHSRSGWNVVAPILSIISGSWFSLFVFSNKATSYALVMLRVQAAVAAACNFATAAYDVAFIRKTKQSASSRPCTIEDGTDNASESRRID